MTPRNTRPSTAASRKTTPPAKLSPRKTRKRASSATDAEHERKKAKTKPTLVIEPVKKGGRKAKVAKDKAQKGNKRGKNRCVTHAVSVFSSYLFFIVSIIIN
jgi:hypothetical protein